MDATLRIWDLTNVFSLSLVLISKGATSCVVAVSYQDNRCLLYRITDGGRHAEQVAMLEAELGTPADEPGAAAVKAEIETGKERPALRRGPRDVGKGNGSGHEDRFPRRQGE